MDVAASRHQPRVRAQPYQDRDNNGPPAADDSGAEGKLGASAKVHVNGALTSKTAESLTRRKFQRTATNPDGDGSFRKPSIPASATRRTVVDRRPSEGARKRNINLREGMRVPSGPRDFPGSPGKRYAYKHCGRNGRLLVGVMFNCFGLHSVVEEKSLTSLLEMATWTPPLLPPEPHPTAPTLDTQPNPSRTLRPIFVPDRLLRLHHEPPQTSISSHL